jgi:hypothetical protein
MKRTWLKRWLGACLLGSAFAPGCEHANKQPVAQQWSSRPTVVTYNPYPGNAYAGQGNAYAGQGNAYAGQGNGYVAAPGVTPGVPGRLTAASPGKVDYPRVDASLDTPVAEKRLPAEAPPTPAPVPAVSQAGSDESKMAPVSEEASAARKSYVDITASPCFSHADDYRWLKGQVQYSPFNKTWRLRYASVDETDRYGGSVTLMSDRDLDSNLKDGQYVSVQGGLMDPEGKGTAPTYRVDSLQSLGKAE